MADPFQSTAPSVPTDFRMVAHLLASAIEEADTGPVKEAVANAARRLGEVVAYDVRGRLQPDAPFDHHLTVVEDVLGQYGFRPYRDGQQVRLANCPFHALAQDHMVLVCGANLAFLDGLVVGLETADLEVWLDPEAGRCCVIVGPAGSQPEYRGG